MTDTQKTGWTLTALIAAVVAIAGLFPHLKPWFDWVAPIFGREQVQAVLAATAVGLAVNFGLPHALPAKWPADRTRAIAGWVGFVLTFAAALTLVPTRIGIVYAFLAGASTPTVTAVARWLVYRLRPCAEPGSLQP